MRGEYTDPEMLAAKMHRLQRWLDAGELPASCVSHGFDGAGAVATVDPTSRSPAASLNRNAIRTCASTDLTAELLQGMADSFEAAGIARYFVWLSPGPQADMVRGWLAGIGAQKIPWTRYPVMVLKNFSEPRSTSLTVREIGRAEIEAADIHAGNPALLDGFLQTLGRKDLHHFAAFDGPRMVATAALAQFEDLAYLTYACTAEQARRRGAQSALIAARIGLAAQLGCRLVVSQTLTMLKDSHANLVRAGFIEAYEKEVYACGPAEEHP